MHELGIANSEPDLSNRTFAPVATKKARLRITGSPLDRRNLWGRAFAPRLETVGMEVYTISDRPQKREAVNRPESLVARKRQRKLSA
jgi:hypothetical protein